MTLYGKDKKQGEKKSWLEKFIPTNKSDIEVSSEESKEKTHQGNLNKKGNSPIIIDGLHFFHGPIKLKMFGRELTISNVRQVGLLSLFLTFVVMVFAILSTIFQLSDASDKGEKLLVKQNIISLVILGIITSIVIFFFVKMIVTIFKNSTKVSKESKNDISLSEKQSQKNLLCACCGAKIDKSDIICPYCGSKQYSSEN